MYVNQTNFINSKVTLTIIKEKWFLKIYETSFCLAFTSTDIAIKVAYALPVESRHFQVKFH